MNAAVPYFPSCPFNLPPTICLFPSGWALYNGRCYVATNETGLGSNLGSTCAALYPGAIPATVADLPSNQFLWNVCANSTVNKPVLEKNKVCYIGLVRITNKICNATQAGSCADTTCKCGWKWFETPTLLYTNWAANQPN